MSRSPSGRILGLLLIVLSCSLARAAPVEISNPGAEEAAAEEAGLPAGAGTYITPGGTNFTQAALRHRYTFNPVTATGVRLIVPWVHQQSTNKGNIIDEMEVYEVPVPGTCVLLLSALSALLVLRRRNG